MWNRYIAGEYGGMNEAMARLFRLTGDRRFIDDREAVRQHDRLLRQRRARARPGQERGHDPRQTRQPAHPADHRRARDVPQHARTAVLPDRVELLGRSSTTATCTASAASPARATRTTRSASRRSRRTLWENGFATGGQNETCATYNLLKLDRQLFMYDQTAKYMDHYERAHLQPHPRVGRRRRSRQHLSRAAQPGRAEAVRQRRT